MQLDSPILVSNSSKTTNLTITNTRITPRFQQGRSTSTCQSPRRIHAKTSLPQKDTHGFRQGRSTSTCQSPWTQGWDVNGTGLCPKACACLEYMLGAGITAATGTRLALQLILANMWSEFKALHARKKERKREREREKETGKGRGEPARAGRGRRKKKERTRHDKTRAAMRSCLVRGSPGGKGKGSKEENPSRPQEEKGGRRRRKRRENEPRNSGPGVPRTARQKNSLNQISKSIQKRTPGTSGNTSHTTHGVHCPEPSEKTRRNKK